jgi:hypothetical protein
MTKPEVNDPMKPDKIQATRKTDVLIAAQLGWEKITTEDRCSPWQTDSGTKEPWGIPPEWDRPTHLPLEKLFEIPRFSTSPAWALRVFALLLEGQVISVLEVDPEGYRGDVNPLTGKALEWHVTIGAGESVTAPTLPLAICRAVLTL